MGRLVVIGLVVSGVWARGAGDYTLSAAPGSVTMAQGQSASATVTLNGTGGYTNTTVVTVSGLPAGVTATLAPPYLTGEKAIDSTLMLTAAADAPVESGATVTVTATDFAKVVRTTTMTVTVQPGKNYVLKAFPEGLTIAAGSSKSFKLTLTSLGGYAGTAQLTAAGLPAGVTATFSPAALTGGSDVGTSICTFLAGANAVAQVATVTLNAADAASGLTQSREVKLSIVAAGVGTDVPTDGLVVDIPFTETTGNVAQDQSGNANTLTLTDVGGGVHAWSTAGLTLNGNGTSVGTYGVFSTPISPGQAQTVIAIVEMEKAPTGPASSSINMLLGAAKGTESHWMWWFNNASKGAWNKVSQQPGYFIPQNGFTTTLGAESWIFPATTTMISMTCPPMVGTGNGRGDNYYINDEPADLDASRSFAGSQAALHQSTNGSLIFGHNESLFDTWYGNFRISRLIIYSRVVSQAEVAKVIFPAVRSDMLNRGVVLGGNVNPDDSAKSLIVSDGDSISNGGDASTPAFGWQNVMLPLLTDGASTKSFSYGIDGQVAQECDSWFNGRRFAALRAPKMKNLYICWDGTNGYDPAIIPTGATGACYRGLSGTMPALVDQVNQAVAAGYQVLIMPMLSRINQDTNKDEYDGRISAYFGTQAETLAGKGKVPNVYVVDAATLAPMTNSGAYAGVDGLLSPADHTHPTDTGNTLVGKALAPIINAIPFPLGAGWPTSATLTEADSNGSVGVASGLWTITLDQTAPPGGLHMRLVSSQLADSFYPAEGIKELGDLITIPEGANSVQFRLVPHGEGLRNIGILSMGGSVLTTPFTILTDSANRVLRSDMGVVTPFTPVGYTATK